MLVHEGLKPPCLRGCECNAVCREDRLADICVESCSDFVQVLLGERYVDVKCLRAIRRSTVRAAEY